MITKRKFILSLILVLPVLSAHAQGNKQLTSSVFEILYSDEGITSLKRVNDINDTNYIAAGSALGELVVRYRTINENDLQNIR